MCPGVMMDLRAGRSPWIPIAAAAASALLPQKPFERERERRCPTPIKASIQTTFAKCPQSAIKSPQQANWRNSLAQFCALETKPAQACESPI